MTNFRQYLCRFELRLCVLVDPPSVFSQWKSDKFKCIKVRQADLWALAWYIFPTSHKTNPMNQLENAANIRRDLFRQQTTMQVYLFIIINSLCRQSSDIYRMCRWWRKKIWFNRILLLQYTFGRNNISLMMRECLSALFEVSINNIGAERRDGCAIRPVWSHTQTRAVFLYIVLTHCIGMGGGEFKWTQRANICQSIVIDRTRRKARALRLSYLIGKQSRICFGV